MTGTSRHGDPVTATRGVLYPTRLPRFTRVAPPEPVADRVRWFWIPEWDLPPGRSSRQHVIAYAASNLVVEDDTVDLFGPTTRAGHQDLTGRGWAVGALLRPAATGAFTGDPGALRDTSVRIDAADLHGAVTRAMSRGGGTDRHERAVQAFTVWIATHVAVPDEGARLANELAELIDTDPTVRTLADVTGRLGVSARTAQRLCRRYIGLPPAALIRRRRLQEAAEAVRTEPGADLADLAAELGYADHAHLTRDFRAVLGFTPSAYRSGAGKDAGDA